MQSQKTIKIDIQQDIAVPESVRQRVDPIEVARRMRDFASLCSDIRSEGCEPPSFGDKIWDLTALEHSTSTYGNRIHFSDIDDEISFEARLFALKMLFKKRKCSANTINTYVTNSFRALTKIKRICQYVSIKQISADDILKYIDSLNPKPNSVPSILSNINHTVAYFENSLRYPIIVENRDKLKTALEQANLLLKRTRDEYKHKVIPQAYIEAIINTAGTVLDDTHVPILDRTLALMILVLANAGLRKSDVLRLTVSGLEETHGLSGTDHRFAYYSIKKTRKQNNGIILIKPYLQKGIALAKQIGSPLLISENGRAINTERADKLYRLWLRTYMPDFISRPWEGIRPINMQQHGDRPRKMVWIPSMHQYRSTFATVMSLRKTPDRIIRMFLGQSSDEMADYYVRGLDTADEKLLFQSTMLKEIAEGERNLIGENGDELTERIRTFIEDSSFNVESDMASIVKHVGKTLRISAKSLGVCIRSMELPCKSDPETDALLCSAGLCKNFYHSFADLPATYGLLEACYHSYANDIKSNRSQATKERNKFMWILTHRFEKEIEELDRSVLAVGAKKITADHPEIQIFINQRVRILKRIEKWKKEMV